MKPPALPRFETIRAKASEEGRETRGRGGFSKPRTRGARPDKREHAESTKRGTKAEKTRRTKNEEALRWGGELFRASGRRGTPARAGAGGVALSHRKAIREHLRAQHVPF